MILQAWEAEIVFDGDYPSGLVGGKGREAEEGRTQAREPWVRTEVMCVRGGAL